MLNVFFGVVVLAIALWTAVILTVKALSTLRADPSRKLVVYGSLAPDQSNHHMVAHMRGSWRPCLITGTLDKRGGHNVLQWQSEGQKLPALLFESDDLPAGWKALDDFEGEDYRRITIPVEVDGKYTVANVYVDASSARTGSLMRS